MKKKLMLAGTAMLLLLTVTGCSGNGNNAAARARDAAAKQEERAKKLEQQVLQLQQSQQALNAELNTLRMQINAIRREERNTRTTLLDQKLNGQKVQIDERVNLAVAFLIIDYFNAIRTNDLELFNSTLPPLHSQPEWIYQLWNKRKKQNIKLKKIDWMISDNVGRPREVVNVDFTSGSFAFSMQKFNGKWKILDLD